MFGHQERVAILLLIGVALAVIAAHLVLVQIGKEPFASAYSDQSADGTLVRISGTIDQATVLKSGGHVLLTIDNVTIFVPATVAGNRSFVKGTAVALYGTVQTYQGKKEILISSADDIREIQ
jgi:DNA/RNA endonuclease YhcR with UshA esterase domain